MEGQTDGQMGIGHINLIGGLVTRNPPKNVSFTTRLFCKFMYAYLLMWVRHCTTSGCPDLT